MNSLLRLITACFAVIIALPDSTPLPALAQSPSYALIERGCVLYSDAALTLAVTTLPESYFVAVTDSLEWDSTAERSVRVSYLSLTGYVSSLCITPVDYTPVSKHATSRLTLINDGGSVNVRSAPNHSADNIVLRLTDGATLEYYGTAEGSVQNGVIGSEWFAVKLEGGTLGYVYSMYVSALPFPPNDTSPEPPTEPPPISLEPSTDNPYFLVAALSFPVVVVMYLLFKKV